MCYTWRFFLCYDLSGRIGENREESGKIGENRGESGRKRTVAKAGVVVLRENEILTNKTVKTMDKTKTAVILAGIAVVGIAFLIYQNMSKKNTDDPNKDGSEE